MKISPAASASSPRPEHFRSRVAQHMRAGRRAGGCRAGSWSSQRAAGSKPGAPTPPKPLLKPNFLWPLLERKTGQISQEAKPETWKTGKTNFKRAVRRVPGPIPAACGVSVLGQAGRAAPAARWGQVAPGPMVPKLFPESSGDVCVTWVRNAFRARVRPSRRRRQRYSFKPLLTGSFGRQPRARAPAPPRIVQEPLFACCER